MERDDEMGNDLEQTPRRRWRLVVLGIFLILLVFVISGIVQGKLKRSENGANSGGQPDADQTRRPDDKNCTSNPKPVFTAEFTDFNNLAQTAPIGAVMAGSPGRAYVMVKGEVPNRPMTPLYAPADATLISLVYAKRDPSNPNAPGEYRLEFRMSCEVTFNFDHMDDVVDKIKAFAPAVPSERSNDLKYVSIPVKAGELVGYSDGTTQAGSFDLFLLNSTKTVPHLNPDRWKWDQVVTADCPYDYYTDELKAKYYSIMRSHDGGVLKPLSCGTPAHDVAGTAAGGWFQGDSTDSKGKWLEMAAQNGRLELNLRENGSSIFSIRDYQTKLLPENIKLGESVCYSDHSKWAYIKLDSESQLSMAKGEGVCPSSLPSSNVEIWER